MLFSGNTCRSPIAEAVFTKLVEESGQTYKWDIDSAALESWHAGDQPNYKAQEIMRKNHIFNYTNRARQVCTYSGITDTNFYLFLFIPLVEVWSGTHRLDKAI